MKLHKKESKTDNCGRCFRYGMMQHYIIVGFHYLLCRECIKDLVYRICQMEMRYKK